VGRARRPAEAAQARRRQDQEEHLRERRIQNETDTALLAGVIAGRVLVDVAEGELRFRSRSVFSSRKWRRGSNYGRLS